MIRKFMVIKNKIGQCPECDNGKEVPLISGRCSVHYWRHRHEVNKAKKNGQKPTEKPKAEPISRQRKPIRQISKKQQIRLLQYQTLRIEFLGKPENRKCPITGEPTTDIHHKKGRIGNLLLDTRFWIALSRNGHRKVEENPEWAKENGFSLNRLSD